MYSYTDSADSDELDDEVDCVSSCGVVRPDPDAYHYEDTVEHCRKFALAHPERTWVNVVVELIVGVLFWVIFVKVFLYGWRCLL
jgi:hypothetical protein